MIKSLASLPSPTGGVVVVVAAAAAVAVVMVNVKLL